MSASRRSYRGCSGIPASTCAPMPASRAPDDLRGKRVGAAGVPDHRGGLDARHDAARIRRASRPTSTGAAAARRRPGRDERTPLKPIAGLDLQPIGKDQTLVGMLRDGELDALFTARGPSSFLRGEPHIQRLFPNTRAAEQAYYKKTTHVPAHAPRRHPQGAGGEISVAADQRLQGVLRGQGARHGRPARRQRPDGDAALAHPGDRRRPWR